MLKLCSVLRPFRRKMRWGFAYVNWICTREYDNWYSSQLFAGRDILLWKASCRAFFWIEYDAPTVKSDRSWRLIFAWACTKRVLQSNMNVHCLQMLYKVFTIVVRRRRDDDAAKIKWRLFCLLVCQFVSRYSKSNIILFNSVKLTGTASWNDYVLSKQVVWLLSVFDWL